ncbi:MAG TPA: heparinase II/III family protein, partial [Candidatus Limnocylindrales bacterium]
MKRSSTLAWRWARLRAMGPAEIIQRATWEMTKAVWRARAGWQSPPMVWAGVQQRPPLPALPEEAVSDLLRDALRVLNGEYLFLGQRLPPGSTDWHRDPFTGVVAPSGFGPDIDCRDPALVGDARTLWELNRLQHTGLMAAAYAVSGDARLAEAVERDLSSWLESNPFPCGPNWYSSLEAALRLIAMADIQRLMPEAPSTDRLFGRQGSAWASIYHHQMFIAAHWARGSSANNHLIGEAAGLLVASTAWPYWRESAKWRDVARSIIEREAVRQLFPDGLDREQAFGYHLFVAELFVAAGVAAERAGQPLSERFKGTVRAMVEAVPRLTDVGGNVPRWGDSDDGRAYRLGPDGDRIASLYHVARG